MSIMPPEPDGNTSSRDEHAIVVTEEFFEYLLAELDRPPRVNPRMVELLRSARGTVVHRDA